MVIQILRWLGVPAVIVGVVGGSVLLARYAVARADLRCENQVGGACVESWHTGVVEWSIYVGVVVTVLLVTLLSAWIAPMLKRSVSVVAALLCVLPLAAAYIVTGWAELGSPIFLAILAAVLGMALVWRFQSTSRT